MTPKLTRMTLVPAMLLAMLTLPAFAQTGNLANPSALRETAPATYKARFETSKGAFVVDVTREWAPNGADRFYNLVKNGFYDGVRFFRVLDGFMAQFGINGDPEDLGGVARCADPGRSGQARATGAASSPTRWPGRTRAPASSSSTTATTARSTGRTSRRSARCRRGMDVVDKLYNGYGEGSPRGKGPDQGRVQSEGNAYLAKDFPRLDFVKKATITK